MKVLVYGVGVIGSLTVHELCQAGNEVSVVARGEWQKTLREKGLRVRKHNRKKAWVDHPRVLSQYDGERYDVTFSIMQSQQQNEMIKTLAGIHTRYLILVGNNMQSAEIAGFIKEKSVSQPDLLFAFQTSGGLRHEDYTEVVTFGAPIMTVGHLHRALNTDEKGLVRQLFNGAAMKFEFMDDMESWYRCHAAFVLPIAYIAYARHCDLRISTFQDVKDYLQAGGEAYDFLKSIGTKIRPKNDDKNLTGIRGALLTLGMRVVFKTKLGEQWVTNHCRNAVTEMRYLDAQFEKLRQGHPDYPMPTYDRLRQAMPSWDEIAQEYGKPENKTVVK